MLDISIDKYYKKLIVCKIILDNFFKVLMIIIIRWKKIFFC